MKRNLSEWRAVLHKPAKGQSLVEMAIIAPILIFMLIGVFEVGWVLRGYLVLLNTNREITRYSIRPNYLNFSQKDPTLVGYDEVFTRALATIADQLAEDFRTNGSIIVSHLVVDTALPCDPDDDISLCNCEEFTNAGSNYNEAQNFTLDDLILHPNVPGFAYYTLAYTNTNYTATTNVEYEAEAERLMHQNNLFNCELLKKGGVPSANNYMITEMYYRQPQLFGFPLISNPLTDPVSLYSRTSMRIVAASRTGESSDTIGPICNAYPWVVKQSNVASASINDPVNVYGSWIKWDSGDSSDANNLLLDQIRYPRMAINRYKEPGGPAEYSVLVVGKKVANLGGVTADFQAAIESLAGQEIILPVSGSAGGPYLIDDFIKVRLTEDIDLSASKITAIYMGSAAAGSPSDHCLAAMP